MREGLRTKVRAWGEGGGGVSGSDEAIGPLWVRGLLGLAPWVIKGFSKS